MGLIREILGIGRSVKDVAEVFVPNATKRQQYDHEEFGDALEQYGLEYRLVQEGWFNRLVNGLNRLPRPVLALGTVCLFVYAMLDPAGFSERMAGLDTVPRELWWLLGAIVSFYFGARELHYKRVRKYAGRQSMTAPEIPAVVDGNAALNDWRQGR
jgi:hypothetical protein